MDKLKIPIATHEGIIEINEIKIKSYVLDNGTRVLNRIQFLKALGRTGKAKGGQNKELKLPVFLSAKNLKPFIDKGLTQNSTPINFQGLNGQVNIGFKAELLPAVCNVFLDAADAEAISVNQLHIVQRCKILIRGFATIGIIALVDEVTGYQEIRDRKALQKILEKFLRTELLKWSKRFPNDFYKEMFRLKNWTWNEAVSKRPGVVGKYTNNIVYERLAPGVLEELKKRNPKNEKGIRKSKHHQWLTSDVGHPKLQEHILGTMALMRASPNWNVFIRLLERSYPKFGHTLPIGFDEKIEV